MRRRPAEILEWDGGNKPSVQQRLGTNWLHIDLLIDAHAGANSVAMEYLLATVSPWLVSFTVYILKGMIGEILFKFASKLP